MRANSGGPFGAVIVRNDTIIAEGWNEVTSNNDPTAHAEIVVIRRACTLLGAFQPAGLRHLHELRVVIAGCKELGKASPPTCGPAGYFSRMRPDHDTVHNFPSGFEEFSKGVPHEGTRATVIGRTLLEGKTIQVPDVLADPEYAMTPARAEVQRKSGFRTVIGIPSCAKDGQSG
jgi:cytidine/deoxycytidylate deaminase-like protein